MAGSPEGKTKGYLRGSIFLSGSLTSDIHQPLGPSVEPVGHFS